MKSPVTSTVESSTATTASSARMKSPSTTTDDAGPGSLRWAILATNDHPGPDTILFDLPGDGVHTLTPRGRLPVVVDTLVIDATTQRGYAGAPRVEVAGDGTTDLGLSITGTAASDSAVRGLAVYGFLGTGVEIDGADRVRLEGNHVGTLATGGAFRPDTRLWLRGEDGYYDTTEQANINQFGIVDTVRGGTTS